MATSTVPSAAPDTHPRILVVDDDPMILQLLTDMLTMAGYDVDTALNGIAALARVEGRRYDLILTDLHMPELDGAGLYQELMRRQAHPPRKIIFITGSSGGSELFRIAQETGLSLLQKPFNFAKLLELIRSALDAP